jgi:integrase
VRYPHQYLPKKSSYWRARKPIPIDVRHALNGAAMFEATTGKTDPTEAAVETVRLVRDWTAQIEAVRQAGNRAVRDDLAWLANEYRQHRGTALDEAGAAIVLDVLGFVMERVGGMKPDQIVDAMGAANSFGDIVASSGRSAMIIEAKTGEALGTRTPFLTYFEQWQTSLTNRKGGSGNEKTLSQRVATIQDFGDAVSEPVETLSGTHVQTWLDRMKNKKNGEPTDAKTKQRKLSDIRPYWAYLQAHDHVSVDRNPFDRRVTSNGYSDVEEQERERISYTAKEVPTLWDRAEVENDAALSDVIKLAAYSGMRLGEIMNLTRKSLVSEDGVPSIFVTGTKRKTRASKRTFPIHSAIADIISRLEKKAGDRFLIPSDAEHREDAMSKRFGRMKTRMGYGEQHVFHGLRHTVIELFRNAGVPLETRNRIVGHEDGKERPNTGADYGGMAGLSKQEIMERVLKYPV